jgi:iron complex outermembrane receptor protein
MKSVYPGLLTKSEPYRFSSLARSSHPACAFARATALVLLVGSFAVVRAQSETPPASGATPPENADDAANQEVVELPSFTVQAQKTPRSIQEVPMSVVAIDTAKVADFKLFNVQDIQNVSPGLDVKTTDARNPIPTIRGVTFNPDSGTTSAVDVYWNETAVSAATGFRAMYDVGQIEVLRGPQGTLRGRSSPGGAITISTRKPHLESYQFSAQQSLSDQNLVNTQAALNVPLVKGKLALRLAGLYDGNNAGDVHDFVTGQDSASHTRSARATLEWKPSENFDLTLVHQVLKQHLDQLGIVVGSPVYSTTMPKNLSPFDRISVNPGTMTYDDKPTLSSLTAVWRLPGQNELTAIVGLQKTKTETNVEFENGRNIIPGWGAPQQLHIDGTNHTYELRFSSVRHEKWNYIFGAYYENGDSTVKINQAAVKLWFDGPNPFVSSSPVPRAPDLVVPLDMTVTSDGSYRGLFTTQTFQLTKELSLEAGVRYQQIKADSLQSAPALGINSPTSRNEKPTTGSASLSYKFRRGLIAYATVGRSYRPGGEGFRNSADELEKYLHYKPETSNGVEVGVKTTWFNNRLQLNADVFYQKFADYISHSGFVFADFNFDGVSDNVVGITFNGDARTQGVEFGMALSLPQHVILNLDATYVDARWSSGRSPASVTNAFGAPVFNTPGEQVSYINLSGRPLGDSPRTEFSSSIDWSRKVRSVEIFTRGLVRYKGARELLNVPNPDIGGYTMVDLFAGVRRPDSRWSVTFWAKNALDRQVVIGRDVASNIGLWSSGYTGAQVAPARELGVTAAFSF